MCRCVRERNHLFWPRITHKDGETRPAKENKLVNQLLSGQRNHTQLTRISTVSRVNKHNAPTQVVDPNRSLTSYHTHLLPHSPHFRSKHKEYPIASSHLFTLPPIPSICFLLAPRTMKLSTKASFAMLALAPHNLVASAPSSSSSAAAAAQPLWVHQDGSTNLLGRESTRFAVRL